MAMNVTREEFTELSREVEGEKMVTRHILEQTRRNGDDLAAIKTRLARVESDVSGLRSEVGGLRTDIRDLRKDMPGIVGTVVREVLHASDGAGPSPRRKK